MSTRNPDHRPLSSALDHSAVRAAAWSARVVLAVGAFVLVSIWGEPIPSMAGYLVAAMLLRPGPHRAQTSDVGPQPESRHPS